jgi:hypothetical protein
MKLPLCQVLVDTFERYFVRLGRSIYVELSLFCGGLIDQGFIACIFRTVRLILL